MFQKISIKALILITVSVLILLTAVVGAVGLYGTSNSVALIKEVTLKSSNRQALLDRIRSRMETNRSHVLQALQHNPSTEYAKMHDHPTDIHITVIAKNTGELEALWAAYLAEDKPEAEKALAAEWHAKSGRLGLDGISAATAFIKSEQWLDAQSLLTKVINPTYRTGDTAFAALGEHLTLTARENDAGVGAAIARAEYITIAAVVMATVLATVIGALLVRRITVPLSQAVEIARSVASGDLTRRVDVIATNEFGVLLEALREMSQNLSRIVANVRGGTDTIATASSQIAAGSQDLSLRTEQQAGSLEETASSMEELTSTVKQNADNARQANALAASASDVAIRGGAVVSEVVETMGSINDSARKIVDIIGVIDGIAFQTNILALNAAVEAARAGEQGRGFAVVASEVRSLAQRSANAAKEIKALISDSVEKVEAGTRLVDEAGNTMGEVVASVKRVSDIIGEIAAASDEQRAGIEQVNQAISQMDNVTQQNAALVEEATAAAHAMQQQASNLSQVVDVFKMEATGTGIAIPSSPLTIAPVARLDTKPARQAIPAEVRAHRALAGPRRAAVIPNGSSDDWASF